MLSFGLLTDSIISLAVVAVGGCGDGGCSDSRFGGESLACETLPCAVFARFKILAVVDAETKQLKQCLKEEQERSAAAWRAATHNRSAPIAADVQAIFDEGHRFVKEKMKLKVEITSIDPTNFVFFHASTSCVPALVRPPQHRVETFVHNRACFRDRIH